MTYLSPKGQARKIRDKWLHSQSCFVTDLTNDIEEEIISAVEIEREACAKIADSEEELPGDPPSGIPMTADTMRAVVRMTKRNIATTIRMRQL